MLGVKTPEKVPKRPPLALSSVPTPSGEPALGCDAMRVERRTEMELRKGKQHRRQPNEPTAPRTRRPRSATFRFVPPMSVGVREEDAIAQTAPRKTETRSQLAACEMLQCVEAGGNG